MRDIPSLLIPEIQHENVKNFNHHSKSVHKVVKFSFKTVEGDEGVELESEFMDVDLPLPDQPVSSPTPKATPLRLPSPGSHSSPAPLVAQPATPPGLGSLRSSSPDLDITPRPLPSLPTQHVTATEPHCGYGEKGLLDAPPSYAAVYGTQRLPATDYPCQRRRLRLQARFPPQSPVNAHQRCPQPFPDAYIRLRCLSSPTISNGDYYGFYNPSDCPINTTLSQLTQIKSMPRNAPKRPRMPINDAANVYHYPHQL
ncbi:hypothetical protein PLEOSDRAFT_1110077 [Pleurotus ostreatus PC15]|uniref:Uncharacterized protein n=1 Tax=Pleurotus ostreatus (strain PC15) TaxID=1137138 RepID=A0A067NCW2_PLEO1|nr:hypothetical protein PLEOSDRAFT_1110077 [Pleurotus ostreatus PC15]